MFFSLQILLEFDDEYDLVDATAEIAQRYKISNRGLAGVLNVVCKKGGQDIDKLKLSQSSVYKKKWHTIEKQGKFHLIIS